MRWTRILLLSFAVAGAGCTEEAPREAQLEPPAENAPVENGEFADTRDLLGAIEQGTFAERAGLADVVEVARLPDPVTVEFVQGTAVPGDQSESLDALATLLAANDQLVVDIIGCSDPSGPEALNQRVSLARARSVAAALAAQGVPEARIREVAGRGEDCDPPERVVHATPVFLGAEPQDVAGEPPPQATAR